MNLLSGAPISLDPDVIRAGTSMDQVIANAIGDQTAFPASCWASSRTSCASKTGSR